jgi:hypothetical protein
LPFVESLLLLVVKNPSLIQDIMEISPRMRDMLATCDATRDEVRQELAALRVYLTLMVNTTLSAVMGSAAPMALTAGDDDSFAERILAAIAEIKSLPNEPNCPALNITVGHSTLDWILAAFQFWRSETAAVLVIVYAWGCHRGVHRWALLLLSILCSPQVTGIWIGIVVVHRVAKAMRAALSCLQGTRIGAWCCPPVPVPDVEMGLPEEDPELSWVREVVRGMAGRRVSEAGGRHGDDEASPNQPRPQDPPTLYGWAAGWISWLATPAPH